jgi:hypothetical protein
MPRLNLKVQLKVETISIAQELNAGGSGVWLGWHKHRGWVFLDRTVPLNNPSDGQYCFVQANNWSLYFDEISEWNNNTYTYYAQHLVVIDSKSKATIRSEVESHCKSYIERTPEIRAQLHRLLVKRNEEALLEETRRRAEEDLQIVEAQERAYKSAEQAEAHRRRKETSLRTLRTVRINRLKKAMLEKQGEDGEAIRQLIAERGIKSLFHFTRIENLPGILMSGIIPRKVITAEISCNDGERLDGFMEASCISVGFPNYKMFYAKRSENPGINWAILDISPEILLEYPCLLYPSNAAKEQFRTKSDAELKAHMGLPGLTSMFFDSPPGLRGDLGLSRAWTTDPQAEVLVFDSINPRAFNRIFVFSSDAEAIRLVQELQPSVPLSFGGPLFDARRDYQFWQNAERYF